jgi:hypothetical protein
MKYLFLLMILVSDLIAITSLQKDRSFANGVACADPIARVVNTNHSTYRFGTPICFEKMFQVNGKEPLKVVCRYSPKIVVIKQSADLSICPKTRYDVFPVFQNEVVRGNVKTTPTLLTPYGLTLRETKIILQWQPVANATYEVTIDNGQGDYRSFNTAKTSLLINSLKAGESYQVVIYTNNSQKSTNVFRILSNSQNKELSSLLKSLDLQQSQMTINDYINLRLAILDKFDLTNESILFATSQFNKYPGNSEIVRALGDLFVKVSRPDIALLSYQYYLDIALYKNIKTDIADAQKRIQYTSAQLNL